jgi:hypothetical protein
MHSIHKLATYTALILVSSLPFSVDVLADAEKNKFLIHQLPIRKLRHRLPSKNGHKMELCNWSFLEESGIV